MTRAHVTICYLSVLVSPAFTQWGFNLPMVPQFSNSAPIPIEPEQASGNALDEVLATSERPRSTTKRYRIPSQAVFNRARYYPKAEPPARGQKATIIHARVIVARPNQIERTINQSNLTLTNDPSWETVNLTQLWNLTDLPTDPMEFYTAYIWVSGRPSSHLPKYRVRARKVLGKIWRISTWMLVQSRRVLHTRSKDEFWRNWIWFRRPSKLVDDDKESIHPRGGLE